MLDLLKPYYRKVRRQALIAALAFAYVARGYTLREALPRVRAAIEDIAELEQVLDTQGLN